MAVLVFASEGGGAGILCFRQVKEITDPELILDWVWEAIQHPTEQPPEAMITAYCCLWSR